MPDVNIFLGFTDKERELKEAELLAQCPTANKWDAATGAEKLQSCFPSAVAFDVANSMRKQYHY